MEDKNNLIKFNRILKKDKILNFFINFFIGFLLFLLPIYFSISEFNNNNYKINKGNCLKYLYLILILNFCLIVYLILNQISDILKKGLLLNWDSRNFASLINYFIFLLSVFFSLIKFQLILNKIFNIDNNQNNDYNKEISSFCFIISIYLFYLIGKNLLILSNNSIEKSYFLICLNLSVIYYGFFKTLKLYLILMINISYGFYLFKYRKTKFLTKKIDVIFYIKIGFEFTSFVSFFLCSILFLYEKYNYLFKFLIIFCLSQCENVGKIFLGFFFYSVDKQFFAYHNDMFDPFIVKIAQYKKNDI